MKFIDFFKESVFGARLNAAMQLASVAGFTAPPQFARRRDRSPGKGQPAGSKLARRAKAKSIGLRWASHKEVRSE